MEDGIVLVYQLIEDQYTINGGMDLIGMSAYWGLVHNKWRMGSYRYISLLRISTQ